MESVNFKLNSEQQKAVLATEGPVLVIAGAGSGKTRVLTARICHLIEIGVDPYNILAITFTNKAANEMKERIERSLGYAGSQVWTSTFHSMCAKILRFDAERLGYSPDFTIYTELESERVVKRVAENCLDADAKYKSEYMWHISRAKTLALSPDDYYYAIKDDVQNAGTIKQVYKLYEEELRRSNSLDFDDLLLKTVELFENCPDVLEKYQRRFKYINVDEFQDTNKLQYKIVKLLAKESGNLFVVGDEDQSIYSWRGAEIKNILDFPKDFPKAQVFKLEQNYRSTTSILKAANSVIKHNANRNEKNLWSENKEENSVEFYEAYNDREEASQVARMISILCRGDESYKDMAVLVRANSLTRTFEEEFNLHGIPYKVFGGFRFFERKEIKDALAYVRLAINPSDNDCILRVVNYPKRGVGTSTVEELKSVAEKNGMTFFSVLVNPQLLSSTAAKKLAPFTEIAMKLIECVKTMRPTEFFNFMVQASGLESALKASGDKEDENRLENIEELVNAVKEFETDNLDATVSDFMQSVALVSDTDEMDDDNYVTIATIHAVKGLEFDNVFIVGCEEGIFPTQRSIADCDVEEERRLMYVAITRARKKLFVMNATQRYRFGRTESFNKSRFIGEMRGIQPSVRFSNSAYGTRDYSAPKRTTFGVNDDKNIYSSSYPTAYQTKGTLGGFAKQSTESKKPSSGVNYDKFVKDTVVEHSKFGRGLIISTSGEGEDKIAAIAFKGLGVKRFSLAVAAPLLKIVEDV
ncbi:MAG: UvrD-helicase domain-containing protein [Clostridia bacterium]|nr:UvrD-helicase domain-containing protein [Clostridia bacterium]